MKRVTRDGTLTQLPNVGPRIAADLLSLEIRKPADLVGKDPLELYESLCIQTKQRHDPCVLDTFMSVVAYMNGDPPLPWFAFTNERKKRYPQVQREGWLTGGF